jgi:hypothetical protein
MVELKFTRKVRAKQARHPMDIERGSANRIKP